MAHNNYVKLNQKNTMREVKFIILGIILSIPIFSFVNPVEVFPVMSEVYFDEDQNWKVEITDYFALMYDSIMIESSSGISKINSFSSEEYDFTVITSDMLNCKNKSNEKLTILIIKNYVL